MLAALLLAPWGIVALLTRYDHRDQDMLTKAARAASASTSTLTTTATWDVGVRGNPGPWGEIYSTPMTLEPPAEFVASGAISPGLTKWVFKGYTPESLARLLDASGVTDEQRKTILGAATADSAAGALVVDPSESLLWSLAPKARAVIYEALGEFAENVICHDPFRYRADKLDEWFDQTDLNPEAVANIRKLLYPRGVMMAFATPAFMSMALAVSGNSAIKLSTTQTLIITCFFEGCLIVRSCYCGYCL